MARSYDRWLEAPYTDRPDPEDCENLNDEEECEGCANCDPQLAKETAEEIEAERMIDDPPDPREMYAP